jgi:DNA polymerase-3 subunit epsilon
MMIFPDGHFCFVDIETSGTKATFDRITEIAVIEIKNGTILQEFQTLINPDCSISPFITQLTGIDNEMVKTAPKFSDIAEELLKLLSAKVFIAHNVRFDFAFIKNEFKRAGIRFSARTACTVKLSRALFPEYKSHSLDKLIKRFGLYYESRHRAYDDADMLVQLVNIFSKQFGAGHIEDLLHQQTQKSSLPPFLSNADIDNIPNLPGVYYFHSDKALLYVGKSVALRERINSHFSSDHLSQKDLELSQQVTSITYELTGGDLGAQLLESKAIKEQQPIYNRRLRKTKKLWYFQLKADKDNYLTVILKNDETLPDTDINNIFGIFRSKKMAEQTLKGLVTEKRLCHRLSGLEKKKSGACFAYQLKRCSGACVGQLSADEYNRELLDSLSAWRISMWPYDSAIVVQENSEDKTFYHLIDQWCYLGSAEILSQLPEIKKASRRFDYDEYKILTKFLVKEKVNYFTI